MGAPQPARAASAATAATRRKQLGAWYTPDALVEHVVDRALDGLAPGAHPVRVLDPACGDGRFLAAVGRRLGDRAELVGCDIDATAVAAARSALGPAATIIEADALTHDWGSGTFDIVVGNPPFLNQLARATTRGGRSRYGGGPYADTAAVFLALAVRLVAPSGRIGLVLPQPLLSARDAADIRDAVDATAAMRWMWWSDDHLFDAQVRVWAGVWEVAGPPGPVQRARGTDFGPIASMTMPAMWAALLTGGSPGVHDGPVLADIATFTADFRDQYYGLIGAVGDDIDGPPLVTSGLIDPGVCHWGTRPVRFAKQWYTAPRVALDRLSPRLQQWAAQRLVPKVLVANQTSVIEAVHDQRGEWLPSVPVITCTSTDLERVMAVLSSPTATEWVHHRAAGSGLGAGSVRLNARLLGSIPLG
jgi:SAM-dependent methyltransferase